MAEENQLPVLSSDDLWRKVYSHWVTTTTCSVEYAAEAANKARDSYAPEMATEKDRRIEHELGGLNALALANSLFEESEKAWFTPAEVAECIALLMAGDMFCDEARARFGVACERVAQSERHGNNSGSN